jgi:putative hydrolase of HD superfamily
MALMVLVTHSQLEKSVDLFKSLKMALYHDLVEAKTGDIPFMETSERQKNKAVTELKAAEEIAASLPDGMGDDFLRIFHEYEERKSPEAKYVKALDHLEVQHQHNLAPLTTWTPAEYDLVYTKMNDACAHDSFLNSLRARIADDAEKKMMQGGVDVPAIRKRLRV